VQNGLRFFVEDDWGSVPSFDYGDCFYVEPWYFWRDVLVTFGGSQEDARKSQAGSMPEFW